MIFIVGAARSGTSLTARVLEQCGANLGNVNSLAEIRRLKDGWIYPQLTARGLDRLGQNPIPVQAIRDIEPSVARDSIEALIGDANCVKDVKLVHFWPIVAAAFPKAKWLVVWREPEKIARSCMRTGFMNAYRTEEDWVEWARAYHARCEELIKKHPSRVFETSINDMRNPDGQEEIAAATEHLGLNWDPNAVTRAFNSSRWTG